ncbi:MAG: hypothetical protein KatS3mg111_1132 [Pirellulaceae bacterium]|nr:MAG: hypothetical protein KatS3mg111_1132 [Pirellulaceae bacterium]
MDTIRKTVRRARRRMIVQRFLSFLPWNLVAGAIVAAIGIATPKMVFLEVDTSVWVAGWAAAMLLLALLLTLVRTWIGRPTLADAAVEVDRRFGLRERLSSALVLGVEERSTELGAALVADAERRAEQIDVRDRFNWGFSKRLFIPVAPALLAAALTALPDRVASPPVVQVDEQTVTRVKNSIKPLVEHVKKKRELAEKEGLEEAKELFKQLEGELAKLEKDAKVDPKQALVKLNDIKQQLENRRKELGDKEELKKSLQSLKKLDQGPAEELADALQKADMEKVEKSLEQLLEKIRRGDMSQEDIRRLEQQLKQLQQAMAEAAEAHEKAKEQLKEQIEQARRSGDMQKAAQLEKKLAEMQAQDATMAQMQQMAQALSKASEAMKQGKMGEAQEAMEELAAQLEQMNQAASELNELDDLLNNLSDSKASMMCGKCNGNGCSACMGSSFFSSPKDFAQGQGTGAGKRDEAEDDVDFFDSRIRDQMRRGETIYGGKVGGPNKKGVSLAEVQQAVLASITEEPEPLEDTPLPKAQREHTRDFFNLLREGEL